MSLSIDTSISPTRPLHLTALRVLHPQEHYSIQPPVARTGADRETASDSPSLTQRQMRNVIICAFGR